MAATFPGVIAFALMAVMLLAGSRLRARLRFLQAALIPPSIIGGVLGFILLSLGAIPGFGPGDFTVLTFHFFTLSFMALCLTGNPPGGLVNAILHFSYNVVIFCEGKQMQRRRIMENQSLGSFEAAALAAVMRLGNEAYGIAIGKEILARTGKEPSIGAIYTTLERLEKKGFLASKYGEATAKRGGRRKRYFSLTGEGTQALEAHWAGSYKMMSGLFKPAGARAFS